MNADDHIDPLTRLAIRHGTDKWGPHFYTPIYHELLAPLRASDRYRRLAAGEQPGFPATDLDLALRLDAFDFAMPVEPSGAAATVTRLPVQGSR